MDEILPPEVVAEIEASMGIASTRELRGQRDVIGFATRAEEIDACLAAAAEPPAPMRLAPASEGAAPVLGAIAPHDDYRYAARVCREVLPRVSAPIVIVVGVFHRYWKLGVRERIGFDARDAWRTPDGPMRVAPLRDAWRSRLDAESCYTSNACHDLEHSIEALAYWLRHERLDRMLLPVLAPAGRFDRLMELATLSGRALASALSEAGLALGRDVALVISADAVHYGADFSHTPFGVGGPEAHAQAIARDIALLRGLEGEITHDALRRLFEAIVDPAAPDSYRIPWCGRFSIPFGMLLLKEACGGLGMAPPRAVPWCYGTSIEPPPLDVPLGVTAPADERHFVGHPGVLLV